jgi:hypothetical protein
MEFSGFHFSGRVFTVHTTDTLIDYAIPSGVPGKLDGVFGGRGSWFDLHVHGSRSAGSYRVTRTG